LEAVEAWPGGRLVGVGVVGGGSSLLGRSTDYYAGTGRERGSSLGVSGAVNAANVQEAVGSATWQKNKKIKRSERRAKERPADLAMDVMCKSKKRKT
jgi:hypothetical protein